MTVPERNLGLSETSTDCPVKLVTVDWETFVLKVFRVKIFCITNYSWEGPCCEKNLTHFIAKVQKDTPVHL